MISVICMSQRLSSFLLRLSVKSSPKCDTALQPPQLADRSEVADFDFLSKFGNVTVKSDVWTDLFGRKNTSAAAGDYALSV